jgi:hypothetical protein
VYGEARFRSALDMHSADDPKQSDDTS